MYGSNLDTANPFKDGSGGFRREANPRGNANDVVDDADAKNDREGWQQAQNEREIRPYDCARTLSDYVKEAVCSDH